MGFNKLMDMFVEEIVRVKFGVLKGIWVWIYRLLLVIKCFMVL